MNTTAKASDVKDDIEVDTRSDFSAELDKLVEGMVSARIREPDMLQDLLLGMTGEYWKSLGELREELQKRVQGRVISPELRAYLIVNFDN